MNANNNELKMPKNYVDMSSNELEYDGGFNWQALGGVLVVGGLAALGGGFLAANILKTTAGKVIGGGAMLGGAGMLVGGFAALGKDDDMPSN